ncbi:MAG: glutaminyl-peptide cyclotransferase [Chitinophagaceae bacterium]|nr:MAG: glutaminyl-peptide cyclotransferase [Chitinophagaceae bacterium]
MNRFIATALLIFLAACNNSTDDGGNTPVEGNPVVPAPAAVSYAVVETFPHDTSSYTQGLLVYKGDLYEGTGNYGRSHLMKVDVKTGRAIKKIRLDPRYFGEGVTILRDTVYQLTWQENVVFVYTLPDFKKVKEFRLPTQGWGLTNDGSSLIVSDGSSNLAYYDPSSFTLQRTQSVTESGQPVDSLNELEIIDGFIYANQYQTPFVLRIDPASGIVTGKIDFSKLVARSRTLNPAGDVLNGIAYDPDTKKIYVTGKLWPELYQVEFSK